MFKTSFTVSRRAFSRTELLLSMGAVSLFFTPASWAQTAPTSGASGTVTVAGPAQSIAAYLNNAELPAEKTFSLPTNSISLGIGGGGQIIFGRLTAEIQNGLLRLRVTRAAGDTNPTAEVALLVTADAGGSVTLVEGSNLKGEATVSVGGVTSQASATVAEGYDSAQDSQSKRKLIRRKVSFDANGVADIEIPFTMSVNAGTSNYADLSQVGAGAQAALSIDSRSVTLSRGGVNEWVDADGTIHGDTVYSHTIKDGIYSERISHNVVGFSAGLVGSWSTALYPLAATSGGYNVTWNWVGADSTAWNSASHTAETGNMVHEEIAFREQKWRTNGQSPKGPTDVTVKYFVFEVNGEKTWEDSIEYNQSDSPVWPTLQPGESTILYFQITYDWMEGKYRVFEKAGEIRSAESDANPAIKSVPYKLYWPQRRSASKSLYFKLFRDGDPEPLPNNAPPIYNIPSHQTS